MKKVVSVVLSSALLVALTCCASVSAGHGSSNTSSVRTGTSDYNSISSAIPLNPVGSDVCYREGTAKDGPVAVAAKDIAGFYATQSKDNHTEQIVIQFTELGHPEEVQSEK